MAIREKALAKINLAQDIYYQAEDDCFYFDMVMASVDLADYLAIEENDSGEVFIRSNQHFLPRDQRNHAYQAAVKMKDLAGVDRGVTISIRKYIPVSAGLGGGSSDAAAVIRGLNRLWHLDWSLDQLMNIAVTIDSDAPYCLRGGLCRMTGSGRNYEPLPSLPSSWLVLAKPAFSISTPKMLAALKDHPQKLSTHAGPVTEAITFSYYPKLKALKERMQNFGAQGVTMTGSGSTIIGFTRQQQQAKRIYNGLKGFCEEVYVVRMNQNLRNIS
ncbi:4-(cytidine 5'-diphospho)-2-C-methyl-D-erythritol kinase [Aerococcus tenax]|uniref:4-(cytidine 5'-diphospho)-2-C-methyl-D-erythritol kinase n=1 Tax=Aerococcus tenax TaxID=3078812 RepID=UPI000DCEF1AC|nr:4-(cytidine 5'-diphospho)-2-C-methyl-D-erythritol kinase [Aerococcus tenax]WIW73653.1 4-(cytidine 5'-diphospho)-2-C-methyl-D-erythritol kinase [Aerococcus tenax]